MLSRLGWNPKFRNPRCRFLCVPHVLQWAWRTASPWLGRWHASLPVRLAWRRTGGCRSVDGQGVDGQCVDGKSVHGRIVDGLNAGLDLVFPPSCVDCGADLDVPPGLPLLCTGCTRLLQRDAAISTCPGCGLPQPADRLNAVECLECQRRRFRFDQVISLGVYRDHLRRSVIRTKQFRESPLTMALGQRLAARLTDQLDGHLPDVVVPVPKFWVKRILRGTNTSEVLAETLGRSLNVPVAMGALRGRKSTSKQSLLGREDRRRNVAGSLQLVRGHDFDKADVLIVDDIMTTGATADEAARVLARAGAGRITVAVLARAAQGREFFGSSTASSAGRIGSTTNE